MGTTIERTIEQIGEVLAPDFQEAAPGLDADTCGDLARETAIQVLVELGLISGEAKRRIDSKIGGKGAAYAIPDDALKLMPSLIKAVGKLLTGNFFAPVPELIGILYRYRTLRVELTADEAAVMRTLRRAANDNRGPLTLAQIGEGLARDGIKLESKPGSVLDDLVAKNARLKANVEKLDRKSDSTALVREVDGRWVIGNV